MLVLLVGHFGEQFGGGGIVLAQALGEIGEDAPVLFFVGDRQGEHLALGKVVELTRHGGAPNGEVGTDKTNGGSSRGSF